MSQPRSIVPGATYLITRRVLRRHLLLRPDPAINQLLIYALAVSASRYGVQVHALCAMSSHLHLVVTDELGVLPRFMQFFHRIVALGTKALRVWEGPIWDHEAASVVRLWTRTAVIEKMAYVLANPVMAGLVRRAREWPGAKVHVGQIGNGALHAKRPSIYFDPSNPTWPAEATLPIVVPPSLEPGSADRLRDEVATEIERLERHAQADMDRRRQRFLGAERACKVSPHDRATSPESLGACNPTFAVGRGQGSAWLKAAAAVRAFRASYRNALDRWRAGVRTIVFPLGTWWMRIFHGVAIGNVAPS